MMSSQQTIPLPAQNHEGEAARTPSRLEYAASSHSRNSLVLHAGRIVLALALLAFAARVSAIFVLHRWTQPNDIEHRQLAMSLLERGTFYFRDFNYYGPSSVQSPPYPFLLAALFEIFGAQSKAAYVAAMMINALAGALTVWLTCRLVLTLGGTLLAAILAAALVAVWPTQVYASTHAQAITLITLDIVAAVCLFQRAAMTGQLGAWIGYSIVITLGALTEPVLLPMAALSGVLILFWRGLTVEQRLRNAAILFAAAMLIIMPWSVRNHRVHGKWIPIKSTFWVNVWKGNNEFATGTDRLAMSPEQKAKLESQRSGLSDAQMIDPKLDNARQYDRLTQQQRARLEKQPESVREDVFHEFASTWIKSHPLRYAQLCAIRLWKTVWVDWDNPKTHSVLFWLPRSLMLVLLLPGIWIARRQGWSLLFVGMLAGSCLLTYMLTIAAARFSLPLEPLALMFVGAFVAWVIRGGATAEAP